MLVFIGSSTEATTGGNPPIEKVAKWIRKHGHTPLRWDDVGLFPPGSFVWPRLLELCSDVDAAVFLYRADDKVWYRGDVSDQPRDNVFIEVGAFSHALGANRTLLYLSGKPRIASDLHGLVYLRSEEPKAERKFNAWLDYVVATPKAAYVVDEHASLRLALANIAWRRKKRKGKKNKKSKRKLAQGSSSLELLTIIETVVINRPTIDWTYVSARQLMDWIVDKFPTHAEDTYWWLIVYGAFRFRDIEQFFDDDDTWRHSVDYAVISERGKAFFMHLQRRHQLKQYQDQNGRA